MLTRLNIQFDLFEDQIIPNGINRVLEKSATELKNDGIERAKNKADKENENWSEKAYAFFIEYAKNSKGPFMNADVVEAAKGVLPEPNDNRAWGHVAVKAMKEGLIKSIGYEKGKKPEHHSNPRNNYVYIGK
jgi:hypothetical protein